MQKYGNVPVSSNFCEKVPSVMNKLLSNTPSGPSAAVPVITVCDVISSFVHMT